MSSVKADQLFKVDGLVVVITGGGTGVGRTIARVLAENGAARVYIIGRNEDNLRQTAENHPNVIVPIIGDVMSQKSLRAASAQVQEQTGYVNLLVPNAGTGGPGLKGLTIRPSVSEFVKSAWAVSPEDISKVYELNCTGVYYTILAFLKLLDQGNARAPNLPKSQVLATASMAGFLRDSRYGFAYSSSKSALTSLMKTFATYCVPWGIRFNSIALGLFPSEMSHTLLAPFKINKEKNISEEGALSRTYLPAERAASEEDIAGTMLYLASKAGSYVNGAVLLVDGGKVSTMPSTY